MSFFLFKRRLPAPSNALSHLAISVPTTYFSTKSSAAVTFPYDVVSSPAYFSASKGGSGLQLLCYCGTTSGVQWRTSRNISTAVYFSWPKSNNSNTTVSSVLCVRVTVCLLCTTVLLLLLCWGLWSWPHSLGSAVLPLCLLLALWAHGCIT